jgi:hypothetical protein
VSNNDNRNQAELDAMIASIHLFYDAEGQDPNFPYEKPSNAEISFLAGFVLSEGWVRDRDR